jgi:hypothetical protein
MQKVHYLSVICLLILLGGIYKYARAGELPQTDPALTVALQDTTDVGGLLLRTKLNWYFSYERPEVIRDGISLSERIPVNLEDFSPMKQTDKWKEYGWFEAVMLADSSLAGFPFTVSIDNLAPSKLWMNGKLILVSGNPSQLPNEEILPRWQNPASTGITLREGRNYFLIEHSEHTVPTRLPSFDRFENGLNFLFLTDSLQDMRTKRGVVFGGVSMLLFLLILIHFYLGLTFQDKYHVYVLLTSAFMLLHAFAVYSDTIVNWTLSYLYFFNVVYHTAFAFVIYFYLISIRTFYHLEVPWKVL